MFRKSESAPIPLNCLTDCNAACCRRLKTMRIGFDLNDAEVAMFAAKGVKLVRGTEGLYFMPADCVFLDGNKCSLHNTPKQPRCCRSNKVGGSLCLEVRAEVSGNRKRYSDVE